MHDVWLDADHQKLDYDERDTQREDWLLRTESLHRARPRRIIREHRRCPECADISRTGPVNCGHRPIRRDSRRRSRRYEPGGAEMNFCGYDHCSDHVDETIRVAAVTKPKPPPDQLEDLLRRLIANMMPRFRSQLRFRGCRRWQSYDSVWWRRYSNRSLHQISWRISSDGCYRTRLPRFQSELRFRGADGE